MRRSSSGVVTPPLICGTTENVPSRWMLACTRSLMNRASRSSTYSPSQSIFSSEASAILLAGSSPPAASAANTAETQLAARARGSPRSSSGLSSGTPGTYQWPRGSSTHRSPPTAARRSRRPAACRSRSPCRPACVHDRRERSRAAATQRARMRPLVTPLQLQTCASSGSSAALPRRCAAGAGSNSSSARSSGSAAAVEGLHEEGDLADVAEQDRADQPAVADDQLLVDAARGLGELHDLVVGVGGLLVAHRRHSTPITLSFVASRRAVVGGVRVARR